MPARYLCETARPSRGPRPFSPIALPTVPEASDAFAVLAPPVGFETTLGVAEPRAAGVRLEAAPGPVLGAEDALSGATDSALFDSDAVSSSGASAFFAFFTDAEPFDLASGLTRGFVEAVGFVFLLFFESGETLNASPFSSSSAGVVPPYSAASRILPKLVCA